MTQGEFLNLVLSHLETLEIEYMVVGSVASSRYGDPRFTRDIDVVMDLPSEQVDAFCAPFQSDDYYCSKPAVRDAVRRRQPFNVIHSPSGEKLDFMPVPANAWGKQELSRRRRMIILDHVPAYVASPEDVILAKLWYFEVGQSNKHLSDIANILKVCNVDDAYLEHWAAQLGYAETWKSVKERVENQPEFPPL